MVKISALAVLVLLSFSADAKKKDKSKVRQVTWLEGTASCPGKYGLEEGDKLNILSPGYPENYPNKFDCTWKLQAIGCQFRIECSDMYTRPSCIGETWKPLRKCHGDYLRFYSPGKANNQTEVDPLDQRYCYTQKANFTWGATDKLNMQFKTNKKHRARGFNCTVHCDPLNFLALFSRDEPEPIFDDPGTTLPTPLDYPTFDSETAEDTSKEEIFLDTSTEKDHSLDDHAEEDESVFDIRLTE